MFHFIGNVIRVMAGYAPAGNRKYVVGAVDRKGNSCALLAIKEFVDTEKFTDEYIISIFEKWDYAEKGKNAGCHINDIFLAADQLDIELGEEIRLRDKRGVPTIAEVLSRIGRGSYLAATGCHRDINYGSYYGRESHVFVIVDGKVIDRTKNNRVPANTKIDLLIEVLAS